MQCLHCRSIGIFVYLPMQVVVQLANTSNFICDHQNFCHPNCYERQRRSCSRLMTALRKVQESEPGDQPEPMPKDVQSERRDTLKDKLKRRVSAVLSDLDKELSWKEGI